MSVRCEICRGARIVRLPIYRSVSAAMFSASEAVAIEESFREYPCPECGETVGMDRVAVLDAHAMVDDRPYGAEFDESMRRGTAHRLVDHLLRGGYITFEKGRTDPQRLRYPMVATVGVVALGKVATLEERIRERQGDLAAAVADEAIKQINNWGSHYSHSTLHKSDAARFIREAVSSVSKSWSKARAAAMKEPA